MALALIRTDIAPLVYLFRHGSKQASPHSGVKGQAGVTCDTQSGTWGLRVHPSLPPRGLARGLARGNKSSDKFKPNRAMAHLVFF